MAQRFESESETSRDAMSDAEVREVLARLAQEKMSPKVGDVADIAGASESDVRRILGELRAERMSVVGPPTTVPETTHRTGHFPMAHSNRTVIAAVILSVALLLGSLMMLTTLSAGPATPPPLQEAAPVGQPLAPDQ